MEFVKIDLSLSKTVQEVYGTVQQMQKNSMIAGGYVTDTYLNKPYKDVDIFIKDHPKTNQEIKTRFAPFQVEERKISSYGYQFATEIVDYVIDGVPFQFVFTKMGICAVKFFDVRFREFFYFKKQAYASKEALLDIEQKQLVFGVSKAPLVAYYRLFSLQERYGYNIEPVGFEKLKAILSEAHIPYSVLEEYIKNKTDDVRLQQKLLAPIKWLEINPYIKVAAFLSRYERDFRMRFYKKQLSRDVMDALFQKEDQIGRTLFYEYGSNILSPVEKQLEKNIVRTFHGLRVKMNYQDPVTVKKWNGYLQNLQNDRLLQMWLIESFEHSFYETKRLCASIQKLLTIRNKKPTVGNTLKIELSDKNLFPSSRVFGVLPQNYLHHRYIRISLLGIGHYLYIQNEQRLLTIDGVEEIEEEVERILLNLINK